MEVPTVYRGAMGDWKILATLMVKLISLKFLKGGGKEAACCGLNWVPFKFRY